ncbi:MAG: UDP-3-O-(3-hydroxymyristoyl)glucosamine N-acyltransferase [Planctomycetota bacterium]|nr:MAG: UDP-3-O-(3-hydroxymyristoyl)glucosamine N-acyltransferase [Planctomycetota bacterium]
MAHTVDELAVLVQGTVFGDGLVRVSNVAALDCVTPETMTFLDSARRVKRLEGLTPGALIVPRDAVEAVQKIVSCPLIAVEDSQGAFISLMLHFRPLAVRQTTGISPQASIHPSAQIGSGTNVHSSAVIEADVTIGANCDIHAGVVIRRGSTLGDEVTLHPNSVLYPGMQLGARVIVHANAVIGADGFGYRFLKGEYVRIPHTGIVRIDDDVEIGACTTIDRAMVGETVIGAGSKIDNLVMIAHNCRIGKHNAFASQVGFAGSITTGDYVRCAGQVGIADHIKIGDKATLGAKAGVMVDIPAGSTQVGIPCLPDKEQFRVMLATQRLPELVKKVEALEQRLAALIASQDAA